MCIEYMFDILECTLSDILEYCNVIIVFTWLSVFMRFSPLFQ